MGYRNITSQEKPRIRRCRRTFSGSGKGIPFTWVCEGRGSQGWHYSPELAYRQWVRNYQKRLRSYARYQKARGL